MWEAIGILLLAILGIIGYILLEGFSSFLDGIFDCHFDENDRKNKPIIWTIKVVFTFAIIGWILYIVIKNN